MWVDRVDIRSTLQVHNSTAQVKVHDSIAQVTVHDSTAQVGNHSIGI